MGIIRKKAKRFVVILANRIKSDSSLIKKPKKVEKSFQRAVKNLQEGELKEELLSNLPKYLKKFQMTVNPVADALKSKEKLLKKGNVVVERSEEIQHHDENVQEDIASRLAFPDLPPLPFNMYLRKGGKINKRNMAKLPHDQHQKVHQCLLAQKMGRGEACDKLLQAIGDEKDTDACEGHNSWVQQMKQLCNVVTGHMEPSILQTLMTIFYRKITSFMENQITKKTVNRAKHAAKELLNFLMSFYKKFKQLDRNFREPSFEDLMAALLSVYVDLSLVAARSLSEVEQQKLSKCLSSSCTFLLEQQNEYVYDVLLQTTMITKEMQHIVLPLFRKILSTPKANNSVVFTKYVATVRFARSLLKSEDSEKFVQVASMVAAPEGYIKWLGSHDISLLDQIPETPHFSEVKITRFFLNEADDDLIEDMINLLVSDADFIDDKIDTEVEIDPDPSVGVGTETVDFFIDKCPANSNKAGAEDGIGGSVWQQSHLKIQKDRKFKETAGKKDKSLDIQPTSTSDLFCLDTKADPMIQAKFQMLNSKESEEDLLCINDQIEEPVEVFVIDTVAHSRAQQELEADNADSTNEMEVTVESYDLDSENELEAKQTDLDPTLYKDGSFSRASPKGVGYEPLLKKTRTRTCEGFIGVNHNMSDKKIRPSVVKTENREKAVHDIEEIKCIDVSSEESESEEEGEESKSEQEGEEAHDTSNREINLDQKQNTVQLKANKSKSRTPEMTSVVLRSGSQVGKCSPQKIIVSSFEDKEIIVGPTTETGLSPKSRASCLDKRNKNKLTEHTDAGLGTTLEEKKDTTESPSKKADTPQQKMPSVPTSPVKTVITRRRSGGLAALNGKEGSPTTGVENRILRRRSISESVIPITPRQGHKSSGRTVRTRSISESCTGGSIEINSGNSSQRPRRTSVVHTDGESYFGEHNNKVDSDTVLSSGVCRRSARLSVLQLGENSLRSTQTSAGPTPPKTNFCPACPESPKLMHRTNMTKLKPKGIPVFDFSSDVETPVRSLKVLRSRNKAKKMTSQHTVSAVEDQIMKSPPQKITSPKTGLVERKLKHISSDFDCSSDTDARSSIFMRKSTRLNQKTDQTDSEQIFEDLPQASKTYSLRRKSTQLTPKLCLPDKTHDVVGLDECPTKFEFKLRIKGRASLPAYLEDESTERKRHCIGQGDGKGSFPEVQNVGTHKKRKTADPGFSTAGTSRRKSLRRPSTPRKN